MTAFTSTAPRTRALGALARDVWTRGEFRMAFALLGSSMAAGMLFGSTASLPVDDARFVGFTAEASSFWLVFLVNGLSVTLILAGVLTGGLLSAVFTSILGTLLGAETALIVKSEGLLTMLGVTGPHAVFELTGFAFALAAGFLPLSAWVGAVQRGEEPLRGFKGGLRRILSYALVAYALVLIGAGVEVVGPFVPR